MRKTWITAALLAGLCTTALVSAADGPVRFDFQEGRERPEGWQLSGGTGRWVERDWLEVTGNGTDSNHWSHALAWQPRSLYQFRVRARRISGSGCVISGPAFANRDQYGVGDQWRWFGHVFAVPDNVSSDILRIGQWQAQGAIQFDAVELAPVRAVHRRTGELLLGEGESIQEGVYAFVADYDHPGSNYHRPLESFTAGFNSNRWNFGGDSQVTYRFRIPGCRWTEAGLGFHLNYHTRGGCTIEVSPDGRTWKELATQSGLGTVDVERLPSELFPAAELLVRLRCSTPGSSFQINRVEFHGKLDPPPADMRGETLFARELESHVAIALEDCFLQKDTAGAAGEWVLTARNTSDRGANLKATATVDGQSTPAAEDSATSVRVAAGAVATLRLRLPELAPGGHDIVLAVSSDVASGSLRLAAELMVPEFYRADYGERIDGVAGATAVWWCEAPWKVARSRAVPTNLAKAARLSAARNDFEAVQIVVRPEQPLTGLTAEAEPLVGPDGAVLDAERVRLLRVHYHFVHQPTDATGIREWWPDALPPLSESLDVAAGENQPLWVLVHVPADARPGKYSGAVRLRAGEWSAVVPLELTVWNFALPERNHIETAFGFSPGEAFRYHQARTEEDRRRLLDLYFQSFAEHRISPYDPVPLDRMEVKFHADANPPRAEIDFSKFDRAFARAVERYRFTGYRLPLQGMGGGTFHSRHDPEIAGFGENTPQYQAMFRDYVGQLERHLRDKGWLQMAYIYWFDEPDPKDYEFVTRGMERLRQHAPGLQRMLTEEPNDELKAPVDIWCPVSNHYDHAAAEKRKRLGERFWWYVCTGPKAPYCTLFIDHPATELRVWLWQTWQRDIRGILVWQSNYWTSSAAFPDKPQDPYEDPMGYVSGYSTPRGVKRHWGNGDGRFIYPAWSARVPGASGSNPVIEGPVSSIRWEMLREGIEDYEMLYLLRERLQQRRATLPAETIARCEALLQVPESITKDMTTFTTDPRPILARRAEIAAAIESLGEQ